MRRLAWLAVFALQTSMFVCGAGIDVCQAGEETPPAFAQTVPHAPSPPEHPDNNDSLAEGGVCLAHAAAHVFIAPPGDAPVRVPASGKAFPAFAAPTQPDIPFLIEQPPKIVTG